MSRTARFAMILSIIALVGLAPTIAAASSGRLSSLQRQNHAFSSGGLGLNLTDWEANYGPGSPGQTYLSYALSDGTYNVGVDGAKKRVVFIERTYDDPAGVSLESAQGEAYGLIPSDATFSEYYDGASARILYGTDVDRFRSTSLTKQVRGTDRNLTGYFAIIYEKIPAETDYAYNVTRYVLIVGTKNPNIG